jgi:hypothetical protein
MIKLTSAFIDIFFVNVLYMPTERLAIPLRNPQVSVSIVGQVVGYPD